MNKELTYYEKGKIKKIGVIKNRVFTKFIDDEKHLMRIFDNTPGVQAIIDFYSDLFDSIRIETKAGKVFSSSKQYWMEHRFEHDFGHGKQYFMSKKNWERQQVKMEELNIRQTNKLF